MRFCAENGKHKYEITLHILSQFVHDELFFFLLFQTRPKHFDILTIWIYKVSNALVTALCTLVTN